LIARIHRAQVMEAAFQDNAFARLAGKARTVELVTNRFINVYPDALTTVIMNSKLAHAFVTNIGRVMIALKLFAV
jgi:hypothetical protein